MLKGGASAELSQKKTARGLKRIFPLCVDPCEHFLLHGAPCNAGEAGIRPEDKTGKAGVTLLPENEGSGWVCTTHQ